jgi:hypothetical protein
MANNAGGTYNVASGYQALANNNSGNTNTAVGYNAMFNNTSGGFNTASGGSALLNNNTGSYNIAIGYEAGNNVAGANSDNILIGSQGASADGATPGNGVIRIGDPLSQTSFFAAGINNGPLLANPIAVLIDSVTGQLSVATSSERFKEDIRDMGDASSGLLSLRPVTFRYKQPLADGSKPIEYGLIAEEVADVYPELVARSADGRIETVKYQVLDSMLLNEVQKQAEQLRQQAEQNRSLEQRVAALEALLAKSSGPAH